MRLWRVWVPEAMDRAVEELLERGVYATRSELVREAVRRLLREVSAG